VTSFVLDTYCGGYCGACPQYIATKEGKAEELGLEPCQGCKSDVLAESWCATCPLKSCAQGRGIEFCFECPEYPCSDLEDFKNLPECPYHQEIYDSMAIIAERGKDAWLLDMRKRWSCPGCGREATWWDYSCSGCGAALRGYVKPTA